MPVLDLAEQLSMKLRDSGLMLATAESCTGGMIAAAITDLAGSSELFERGFITYSNDSKTDLLGVAPEILNEHGAVSSQTAIAMAKGALASSRANIAVSVTGIAGPGGGTADKPVGLVYIAYGFKGENMYECSEHRFNGDRAAVRQQTVEAALNHLLSFLNNLA